MIFVTVFRQKDITNAAVKTLDKLQSVTVSHENEERIWEIQKGIELINGCNLVDAEKNESDVMHILLQCHNKKYIEYIRTQSKILSATDAVCNIEYTAPGVDPETFLIKGIYETALAAFCTSVQAAKHICKKPMEFSYALSRPPGHHAGSAWMGGYCYFNNAAGAVFVLKENGHNRIGLIDLDFHFGNGSADIFKNIPEVFFGSIHASTIENFPYKKTHSEVDHQVFISFSVPPAPEEYFYSTESLIKRAINYGCSALVISVGYDVVSGDPHGNWTFQPEMYFDVGQILQKAGMPICFIQEGGYNLDDLGKCAYNLIKGLMS
ncbi:MAG: hypothetical protein LBL58_08600 [Tannerellaceae bacterium]|jgi:acetoin utilization deacetylase AcuC-like enzyme|nr:hypothetical protein [Tannerellaceae bacterium]